METVRIKEDADHFNPFHATGLFRYSLKTSENLWFFIFSGGIERDQWHEMGERGVILKNLSTVLQKRLRSFHRLFLEISVMKQFLY